MISMLIGIPRKIVFTAIIGTNGFGLLRLNDTISRYGSYFDLGMYYSLSRQIPLVIGAYNSKRIRII